MTMSTLSKDKVAFIEVNRKSIILKDGTRVGFAKARRMGLDVEDIQTEVPVR
jgi:hypothetical protein